MNESSLTMSLNEMGRRRESDKMTGVLAHKQLGLMLVTKVGLRLLLVSPDIILTNVSY